MGRAGHFSCKFLVGEGSKPSWGLLGEFMETAITFSTSENGPVTIFTQALCSICERDKTNTAIVKLMDGQLFFADKETRQQLVCRILRLPPDEH